MAKRKKNQDPKTATKPRMNNSNALFPARAPGEEPELPPFVMPVIKTENVEEKENDIESLMSLLAQGKRGSLEVNASEGATSSMASISSEPMETDEPMNFQTQQNHSENNTPLESFGQIHVKQEPMEADDPSENSALSSANSGMFEESGAQVFVPDHASNASSNSMNFNSDLNGYVKKEPSADEEFSANATCDQQTVTVKKESVEDDENDADPEIRQAAKRKMIEERLEYLRKKIKVEKDDESEQKPVLPEDLFGAVSGNGNESEEQPGEDRNETIQNMHTDTSEDIAILPVQKVEKVVPVIDLVASDEDETEEEKSQDSDLDIILETEGSRNTPSSAQAMNSSTNSPKKKRDFSTDILRYFNVLSEIDRYDLKTGLEYISSKYETKSPLHKLFPVVKKEKKSTPREIKKGDILFKKVTEKESQSESSSSAAPPLPGSVPFGISDQAVMHHQPAAEQNLLSNGFPPPIRATETGAFFAAFPVAPAAALPVPSYSGLPVASHSVPPQQHFANFNANPQPPNSSISSLDAVSVEKLQEIIQHFQTLPVSRNTQAPIADLNQRPFLQDPRSKRNLPGPESEGSIPVSHTAAMMIPQAPTLASAPRISVSSYQVRNNFPPSASPPQPVSRDPRIAANNASFGPRKGTRDLLLYQNIGKDDVSENFEKIILQWNPSWLHTQLKTNSYPPICSSYPTVAYFYANEMAYYNTYVPLHFLHMWHEIFECWRLKRGVLINCKCDKLDKKDDVFKISCFAELDERQVEPKSNDIALCRYEQEEAFLRIEEVKSKNDPGMRKKFRLVLETLHDLKLREGANFQFYILLSIRIPRLATKSLKSLDNNMKDLVLKPENYRENIEVIKLTPNKGIKDQRNEIIAVVELNHARVVLVETCHMCDVNLLLTHLAYHIAYGQRPREPEKQPPPKSFRSKVLICLKNEESLRKLHKRLADYKPVLAVRSNQLTSLAGDLDKHSIQYRMDKGEKLVDILNSTQIFLTTFSSFGLLERNQLLKVEGKLTCIVDDAHLCSEVETTPLLTLKLAKLLLLGNKLQYLALPRILFNHRYNISFFVRLLKAKQGSV